MIAGESLNLMVRTFYGNNDLLSLVRNAKQENVGIPYNVSALKEGDFAAIEDFICNNQYVQYYSYEVNATHDIKIGFNASCTIDRWTDNKEIGATYLFALGPNA